MTPREVLLELVEDHITEDSPWVGRQGLRHEARKEKCPIALEAFDRAYRDARDDVAIVTWHGLTTLAEEPYLTAALEAEVGADITRTQLVARLNQVKAGTFQPPTFGLSDPDNEGLTPEEPADG